MLELLVAVVIVVLLASVAYPSYRDQVQKGRRSDAVAALGAMQLAQERHRASSASYANSPQVLGLPVVSEGGHYDISIQGAGASSYTLVATARAGSSQTRDSACLRMAIGYSNGSTQYLAGGSGGELALDSSRRCWPV
jgi:type IV pilus assembly protein PilE